MEGREARENRDSFLTRRKEGGGEGVIEVGELGWGRKGDLRGRRREWGLEMKFGQRRRRCSQSPISAGSDGGGSHAAAKAKKMNPSFPMNTTVYTQRPSSPFSSLHPSALCKPSTSPLFLWVIDYSPSGRLLR